MYKLVTVLHSDRIRTVQVRDDQRAPVCRYIYIYIYIYRRAIGPAPTWFFGQNAPRAFISVKGGVWCSVISCLSLVLKELCSKQRKMYVFK